eukprot:TRINITY_DN2921_c0_g1_i7.p1 TRINITY_DN2921_c0_g1~~TRINITY_DN2921_c0_g1_i7.p1  ORF type:complete len:424 (+),score=56.38 TRINITY_DN2921_c0_g1_i7:278-1549(+)
MVAPTEMLIPEPIPTAIRRLMEQKMLAKQKDLDLQCEEVLLVPVPVPQSQIVKREESSETFSFPFSHSKVKGKPATSAKVGTFSTGDFAPKQSLPKPRSGGKRRRKEGTVTLCITSTGKSQVSQCATSSETYSQKVLSEVPPSQMQSVMHSYLEPAESSYESEPQHGERKLRGVRRRKWGKWVSEIREPHQRKRIWLGSFSSPEAAGRAYDVAARLLRGPQAQVNFPDSTEEVHLPPATVEALLRASQQSAALFGFPPPCVVSMPDSSNAPSSPSDNSSFSYPARFAPDISQPDTSDLSSIQHQKRIKTAGDFSIPLPNDEHSLGSMYQQDPLSPDTPASSSYYYSNDCQSFNMGELVEEDEDMLKLAAGIMDTFQEMDETAMESSAGSSPVSSAENHSSCDFELDEIAGWTLSSGPLWFLDV